MPRYTIKKLYTDTYSIADGGFGQGKVYMYLLVGSEKALLVDSGYGLLDLRAITSAVTEKPVVCVCTHGHIDHALGARQFDEAYLHSGDFDVYRQHTDPAFITNAAMNGLLIRPPRYMLGNPGYKKSVEEMAGKDYPPLLALDDRGRFELGGRTLSWRLVPGHTQGSIVVVDEEHATVFDTDAAAPGAWLFLPESSPLPEYRAELERYRAFLRERDIKRRYVGHAGKAFREGHIGKLIRCAEIAEAKPRKGIRVNSPLGDARIVFAGGSLLFCGR
ncbi:MAG: MBL fold metallo-hydrolase [Clostridiales Family XIII bacterium]|jgi:glyoxylase-like metal-dependent hydrolase (beta-lactamase superfamily II)|nr:MBL fold metallo-hydrolase [Clostridiales Family XIII bacterium]